METSAIDSRRHGRPKAKQLAEPEIRTLARGELQRSLRVRTPRASEPRRAFRPGQSPAVPGLLPAGRLG